MMFPASHRGDHLVVGPGRCLEPVEVLEAFAQLLLAEVADRNRTDDAEQPGLLDDMHRLIGHPVNAACLTAVTGWTSKAMA